MAINTSLIWRLLSIFLTISILIVIYSCSCSCSLSKSPKINREDFKIDNKSYVYTFNSDIKATKDNEIIIPKPFRIRIPCGMDILNQ